MPPLKIQGSRLSQRLSVHCPYCGKFVMIGPGEEIGECLHCRKKVERAAWKM